MASDGAPAVELKGITKAFGAMYACRDVGFSVRRGTVHALVGENGAGKSTTMKILYGLLRPDAGWVKVHGAEVKFRTPRDAGRAGIGMVHQHFMLAGPYSGLDNIILGAEPGRFGLIDRRSARRRLAEIAKANHFPVDLDAPVATLPVGVQQRLEILKLLYRDADILILDEPTAVLTPQEVDELFVNLRRLRDQGKTILIITHKLKEVRRFCDDLTVLRRGEVVGSRPVAGITEAEIAALMVGRAVDLTGQAPPPPVAGQPRALAAQGLTLKKKGAPRPLLDDLSFEVAGGEIVGIAGIEGNGQTDLLELLSEPRAAFLARGRRPVATGSLSLVETDARRLGARAVRDLGVGFVAPDRQRQGLLMDFDLTRNFLLGLQRRAAFSHRGLIRFRALFARVVAVLKDFDVRPAEPSALARGLSGGNQQKLIVARELERGPRLLVAAQPTRGVDVGSIELLHGRLMAARAAGMGVLVISSELEEIMHLADRILVFFDGRIVARYQRGEATESMLGIAMGGAHA